MSTRPLAAASVGRTARLAATVLAGLTLAACDGPPSAPVAAHAHVAGTAARAPLELTPRARRELATLRAATARFHDPDAAAAAGYDAELTGCMSNPLHDAPEILVYEPLPDGRRRLVRARPSPSTSRATSSDQPRRCHYEECERVSHPLAARVGALTH